MRKRWIALLLGLAILLSLSSISETVVVGTVYVSEKGGSLHLRDGRGTDTRSLGFVKHGDNVIILDDSSEWYRINVVRTGQTGFIKAGYIKNIHTASGEAAQIPAIEVKPDFGEAKAYTVPGEFTVDLDLDGVVETVYAKVEKDEVGAEVASIEIWAANGANDSFVHDMTWSGQIWFVKLGSESRVYMFLSGDVMSDDYMTVCFYWDGASIQSVLIEDADTGESKEIGYGAVESIQNERVVFGKYINTLGTWGATYPYALDNGKIACVPDEVWHVNVDMTDSQIWKDRVIVTSRALPATVFGKETMLAAGEKLTIVAIERDASRAYFVTPSGDAGYFTLTTMENGWESSIGGIPENDCFKTLPYSG